MSPGRRPRSGRLGILYDQISRPEEAIAFLRQAADKYLEVGDLAGEGRQRNNVAYTLGKLGRLDEARQEIRRGIECNAKFGHASEPWKSWAILNDIETDADNAAAVAEARGKAIASYLDYRRAGGENHSTPGRLFYAVTEALRQGGTSEAERVIAEYREQWNDHENPEADALQAIVADSRDRNLADAPNLDYMMAAEIRFLIESLEKAGS